MAGKQEGVVERLAGLQGEDLQRSLDELGIYLWQADARGRRTYISPSWVEYTGLSLDELEAFPSPSATHPDDLLAAIEIWKFSLENLQAGTFSARLRSATGEYRWFQMRFAPKFSRFEISGWFGTISELAEGPVQSKPHKREAPSASLAHLGTLLGESELRGALKQLTQTEERVRDALHVANAGVFCWTSEGEGLYFSPEYRDLLGFREDEEINFDKWLDRLHPDDRPRLHEEATRARKEEGKYSVEYRVKHPARGDRWIRAEARSQISPGGEPIVIGVALDITDRKLAIDQLNQSREHFKAIAEMIPSFIYSATAGGKLDYANPGFVNYLGFDPADTGPSQRVDSVHPDDQKAASQAWYAARDAAEGYTVDMRIRGSDGVYRWFCNQAVPLKNSQGAVIRWYGVLTSIDDHKQAELDLESKVLERTAELEMAYKEQEAFNYSVSHDLRAPLRAISGTSAMLREDFGRYLPDPAIALIDRQIGAAKRLGDLIDDLLEYSRIGRVSLTKRKTDLAEICRSIQEEHAQSGRPIRLHVAPTLKADGDPMLLRLLLQNLIGNAVKFSRNKPVTVGRQGDAYFVRDKGIGFDMAYAGKLFQPFQRLHADDQFVGTGIGLAIVRRIAERHGGRAWAESREGHGATFWFTLARTPERRRKGKNGK